jgi:hypothetical protein
MNHEMNEVCPCKLGYSTNTTFSDAILVVSTGTTEGDGLPQRGTMTLEFCRGKDAIVRMVGADFEAKIRCCGFNYLFASNCSGCSQVSLRVMKDLATSMIDVESTITNEPMSIGSSAKSGLTATTNGRHIVITRDALAREKVVGFEDHFRRVYCGVGW